jgi:hypothetical protein
MRRRRLAARLTTAGALALLPVAATANAAPANPAPGCAAPAAHPHATPPAYPPPAYAAPLPLDRDGQITDRVDALRDRRADPGGGSAQGDVSASDFVAPVAAAVVVVALAAYSYRRRRATPRPVHLQEGGPIAPPPTPLPELDARARDLLVETDDAIRTSQEELGFATAQFGGETARPFAAAVGHAQAELTAAFRLRQALDDAYAEDDTARRAMLEEIITRCTDANARLDAESDAFDELRAMVSQAPRILATAEAVAQRLPDRIHAAERTLTALAGAYDPASFAAVAGHPAAARDRLQFADENLTHARSALAADDPATTAVHVRAAESAVGQAGTLADAVVRREQELHEAAAALADALRDIRADLADAQGVVRGTAADEPSADLQGRVARAEAVLAEVEQEMSGGPYDPLATLRRVEEADAALEESLAGAREREEAERRAGRLLDQALVGARSSVAAAGDFVTTHRGGVGPAARTRLTEGERHLQQAVEHAGTDTASALRHAQRADELGREALRLAEQDVHGFDGSYGGGPFGGRYGRGYGGGRGGMGTGMLGGIILGGMLGGGFGGGFGRGPGSFGGGGTRGRMGGGGRF